jgi:glyceraldehyde 3-phosphate dehydrogenase
MSNDALRDQLQAEWDAKVALAEQMIPVIGRLHREHGVVVSIYGRPTLGQTPIGLLKAHRYARRIEESELDPRDTLSLLDALVRLPVAPVKVDVAELARRVRTEGGARDLGAFLRAELPMSDGEAPPRVRPAQDVVLYGFGRIGRMMARYLIEEAGNAPALALRAVVVRSRGADDIVKRASLLRRDSIHGPFEGTITVDRERQQLVANGTAIQFLSADSPDAVDYEAHGIRDAIVVDSTGRWRDEAGLSLHLRSPGASRVLLTAPGKGALPNIVHGVNHRMIGDARILSAASCTTNAITPVLKAVHDRYGVRRGHVETVHSYTNDQNLVDNIHPASRRGRAAGLNMVITETGAAKAVAKAIPELEGRLTGSAIRVPTPNVSLAILNLGLERGVTKEDLNGFLRSTALTGELKRQIDFIDSPEVVSTDFNGSRRAGIVDGLATVADGGTDVVLYVWYDNEGGYSRQVFRVLKDMAGVSSESYPRAAAATEGSELVEVG